LADYNQAIAINPEFSFAYLYRAFLKENKLNDVQGALADYNQAIIINSEYADAYLGRAIVKASAFKDFTGAIEDLRQAARLYKSRGETESYQQVVQLLKKVGTTE
jgi:tetratricopeptide (TPR) repeat protein